MWDIKSQLREIKMQLKDIKLQLREINWDKNKKKSQFEKKSCEI